MPFPRLYRQIQRRICEELEVDPETVDINDSPQAERALRAFAHLAYLWSDPAAEPEGRYDSGVHVLVWYCARDVYIMEGVPDKVPVRMQAIAAEAVQFRS